MPYLRSKAFLLSLFVMALSACQSHIAPDAKQKIVKIEEKTLAYFQKDGQYSAKNQQARFHRKLYGKTANNDWVVQDFYQHTHTPQTNIFIIFDERGLYEWDNLPFIDGTVIFYFPDGSKKSMVHLQKGQTTGIKETYYASGEVFKKQFFNAQHETTHEDYLLPNGHILMRLHADATNQDGFTYQVYDEQGQAYIPTPENKELFLRAITHIEQTEIALLQKQEALSD